MKDTVAIVGSHPRTRGDFDFSREDADIWVFNEALATNWCKRADAVFQLHEPTIWRSTQNRNDPKHYEWLQNTTVPVYMQDHYEDVPSSIRYPLDELFADLFEDRKQIPYITSSVAYALALAVYLKYKRIELYGVEMETNTEYGHQRIGVAFWVGVALGRGIEVDFHSDSVLNAPLYGYEGGTKITIPMFEERVKELKELADKFRGKFDESKAAVYALLEKFESDYKAGLPDLDNLIQHFGQNAHSFGMADGSIQADEFYLNKCLTQEKETGNYLIVKQEYESGSITAQKSYQFAMLKVYDIAKNMRACSDKLKTCTNRYERRQVSSDLKKILDVYAKNATEVGMASGIVFENKTWMAKLDQLFSAAGGEKAIEIMSEPVTANVPLEMQR